MSATTTRMRLDVADRKARALVALLDPVCERIEIAGSVRRCRADIGDIEIVAIPKIVPAQPDLFGAPASAGSNALNQRIDELVEAGVIQKRARADGKVMWGPKHRTLTWDGAPVDLWQGRLETFGWLFVLRTGPAQFSRQLVVPINHRTRDDRRGLLPAYLRVQDGLRHIRDGEQVPTPEEIDVFKVLGLRWLEPEDRR